MGAHGQVYKPGANLRSDEYAGEYSTGNRSALVLYSVILFLEVAMPGELPQKTIAGILKVLPMGVTFIDENDIIRY